MFGDGIFDNNNKLIRAKLAQIVFKDAKKLELLNAIIHPLVLDDFLAWAEKTSGADYLVYESALLFESGFNKYFDQCILVTSPKALALQRVMERDAITEEEFEARATKQLPESEKIPLANQIIINDGKRPLIPQVLNVHKRFTTST